MKFATHVVLFGQDKWIMRNIENSYPHVERIYIAYSDKPWSYNAKARSTYSNSFDLSIIRNSKFSDKVTIIEGVWDTEEAQRNACVDQANKDGMDYLLIHDADEFYFHETFDELIKSIEEAPNYDYYKVHWRCFWKSFNYVLLDVAGLDFTGSPEFCINLKRGVRFQAKRRPNKTNWYQPKLIKTYFEKDGDKMKVAKEIEMICYHGSYVLTDQELYQKINTWGHANDFDREKWYKEKWLKWTPEMRDLHLVSPSAWSRAVVFKGTLPEVIADMK